MTIPASARAMSFLATTSRETAKKFYGETLGLKLTAEDPYAMVFETDGRVLRISPLQDFKPQSFTVMGWAVDDIAAAVKALKAKGIVFEIYPHFKQDALGIWTPPGSNTGVAWFKDPDGNILSLTQF